MTRRLAAGLLAGLLAGPVAAAQTASANSAARERVESGHVRSDDGALETYRIRLLPVESFPALPEAVANWLRQRGCMIPQTFEAQEPENVIHGAFRAPDSDDWAVLCSVGGTTTLYAFLAGHFSAPAPLRSQPDILWLGHEPGSSLYGSAWGISTRSAEDLHNTTQIRPGFLIDHDAIEDADLERSLTLHYLQAETWQTLLSENFR
jgi:hypothetical protein